MVLTLLAIVALRKKKNHNNIKNTLCTLLTTEKRVVNGRVEDFLKKHDHLHYFNILALDPTFYPSYVVIAK